MLTYQDLLDVGENEIAKGQFCARAIREFRGSREYAEAQDGESYYNKHNVTIEKYQKFLYTVSGNKVDDVFSANYKLKTLFFRRLCNQQIQYVLGNGLTLSKPKNKEKLGKRFDKQLVNACKRAMAGGRAFGFWNYDHLEVFGYADTPTEPGFCPLYDEYTAELMGGIRFWFKRVGDKLLCRFTLYEPDGYTEYRKEDDNDPEIVVAKKGYITTTKQTVADGVVDVTEENYHSFPIVPLYVNDSKESELIGIRECIDCYDFIKSNLANTLSDTDGFYWILKNTGGMDDRDLAQFVQRMKTVKASVVDGDDGATAEAHTLDVPVESRRVMLEILQNDIYDDFQSLNIKTLSASAKTTQEIQSAYQSQDNKCADFEYYVIDFVQSILELAGIDDNPTFVWNKVVNQTEQTNMILMASNYLTEEMVIKHLPFLTPEEVEEVIKQRESQNVAMFNAPKDDEDDGEEDEPEEDEPEEDE